MKEKDIKEWIEKIKLRQWLQALSPVLAPVILFSLWLGFAKLDKRASALSKLIAITEPIPTIDLSLPKPVVLASLYHSTEDALRMLDTLSKALTDLPNTVRELFDEVKDEVTEDTIPDIPELPEELDAITDCANKAKKNLGFLYGNNLQTYVLIQTCLLQKGYAWSTQRVANWINR